MLTILEYSSFLWRKFWSFNIVQATNLIFTKWVACYIVCCLLCLLLVVGLTVKSKKHNNKNMNLLFLLLFFLLWKVVPRNKHKNKNKNKHDFTLSRSRHGLNNMVLGTLILQHVFDIHDFTFTILRLKK